MRSGPRGSGAVRRTCAPTMSTATCSRSDPGKKYRMMNIILNGFFEPFILNPDSLELLLIIMPVIALNNYGH